MERKQREKAIVNMRAKAFWKKNKSVLALARVNIIQEQQRGKLDSVWLFAISRIKHSYNIHFQAAYEVTPWA